MSADDDCCALELSAAAEVLQININPGKPKAPGKGKGKGTTMSIFTTHKGGKDELITLQMPRALTFGVRMPTMSNSGGGATLNYQAALKYRMDQSESVVDPLRDIHDKIKAHITHDKFHVILPKTTAQIVKKLNAKHAWFPKDLFDVEEHLRDPKAMELFIATAEEKVDEICIFGGSEESHADETGKAKMVSFAPEKANNDGGVYEKSWMINLKAPIETDKQGNQMMHDAPKEEDLGPNGYSTPSPVFTFTACEGPEYDLSRYEEIKNINMLRKVVVDRKHPQADVPVLGPEKGEKFSREGIAVISLRFVHIRDDESQISVNMTLEHIHTFARDAPSSGKRKFVVKHDKDTPQTAPTDPTTVSYDELTGSESD